MHEHRHEMESQTLTAAEQVRRAEARFLASQEASLFGFTILRAIRCQQRIVDFEWEYVNPAASSILRRPIDELVGHRLLDVLPNNKDRSDLFARYVQVVETGEPHDYELRYDGEQIRGWFRNMAVKLDDGVAISFADVTPQHEREAEVRASEARLRQFAESMPHIVWVADAEGHTRFISKRWEQFTGASTAEGLQLGWSAWVHPDDVPLLIQAWNRAIGSGVAYEAEYRLRRADGVYRWQIVRGYPARGRDGGIESWFGSSTDIDDARRHADALRDADRRKDEFLAILAHELRNPLAPLGNAVAMLEHAEREPTLLPRARSIMERQVRTLARLIDDLMDVSRITRNQLDLRRETTFVHEIVHDAIEACRPSYERAAHRFTLMMPEEPLVLHADRVRLTQVLSNLLMNACKYTPAGGHITLHVLPQQGEVLLTVRDSGVGIAPELLPRIFELFTQGEQDATGGKSGLGIGLALVRQLTAMHGGDVTVQSEGPGLGSTFTVRLPTIPAERRNGRQK
jgi:PAS domain S-box-containing protein